jgi:hypothetical protein
MNNYKYKTTSTGIHKKVSKAKTLLPITKICSDVAKETDS